MTQHIFIQIMWCHTGGQTRQLCVLFVHIGLCIIALISPCRASFHHEREPRLRKLSHWKAILSWISKPVQRIPDDKPFYVVWNAPSFRCGRQYGLPMDLEKFGIIGNEFELFHGEAVNLFYESRLGFYPRYLPNNKPKYGGLPQLANITAHLEWVKADLDWYIPNITYNGLAVIDWESWRPIFDRNWKDKFIYKAASVNLVAKEYPTWRRDRIVQEAKREFEKAARDFMEKTLSLCRELRPKAKWGFYLFPDCYNYKVGQENCTWIVKQRNDRLAWLYRSSSALYPSIYLTSLYRTRDQKHHVRGILNEAYRVRKRFTSPFIPVIPYTKYVYTNTDRFYDKIALENTIGEAMNSGAAGVSLWDSTSNIQTKKQCQRLNNYLNYVLGPYVKKLLQWSGNCSQNLCGGHGRCVSVDYQPRKSTRQRVVIQKGPTIEKVVVSKQSKSNFSSENRKTKPPQDTTIKITPIHVPLTVPISKDNAMEISKPSTRRIEFQNTVPTTATSFFKTTFGLSLKSTPIKLLSTTPRTSSNGNWNISTKTISTPGPDGTMTDKEKVIHFPLVTKDGINLPYQKPKTLPTDQGHNVETEKTTNSISIPDIHPSTPAYNHLSSTQMSILNSSSKDLGVGQRFISETSKKNGNQILPVSQHNNLISTVSVAASVDFHDDVTNNGTNNVFTKESDLKMYDNRSEMSLKRPVISNKNLDGRINNTTQSSKSLLHQSIPPFKLNSSMDIFTQELFPVTKDLVNQTIDQPKSRPNGGNSHKVLSTVSATKTSSTTADPLSRSDGGLPSATNVSPELRITVDKLSSATNHSSKIIDFPILDRGRTRFTLAASSFSKTRHVPENSATTESLFINRLSTNQRTASVENTTTTKSDTNTTSYRNTSQTTIGQSLEPVDKIFVQDRTINETTKHTIDDKYSKNNLSFTSTLVQVVIILVVALRRLFAIADLQSDSFISKSHVGHTVEANVNQYGGQYTEQVIYRHARELGNPHWGSPRSNERSPQKNKGLDRELVSASVVLSIPKTLVSGIQNQNKNIRKQKSGRLTIGKDIDSLTIGKDIDSLTIGKDIDSLTIGKDIDSLQINSKHTPRLIKDSLASVNQEKLSVHINKSGSDPNPKDRQSIDNSSKNRYSKNRTKPQKTQTSGHTNLPEYDNYICRCYHGWTGEFCDTPT